MTDKQKTGLARVTEAGEYLKISRNMIYLMMQQGKLPYEMIGCHKRIPWTAIYKFAEPDQPDRRPTSTSKQNAKLSKSDQAAIAEALDRIVAELTSIRGILCQAEKPKGK